MDETLATRNRHGTSVPRTNCLMHRLCRTKQSVNIDRKQEDRGGLEGRNRAVRVVVQYGTVPQDRRNGAQAFSQIGTYDF